MFFITLNRAGNVQRDIEVLLHDVEAESLLFVQSRKRGYQLLVFGQNVTQRCRWKSAFLTREIYTSISRVQKNPISFTFWRNNWYWPFLLIT